MLGFAKILSVAAVALLIGVGLAYSGRSQQNSEQNEFAAVIGNQSDGHSPGAAVLVRQNGQTSFFATGPTWILAHLP